MMLHLILVGAGLALGLVPGAWAMHAVYERDGGRMDACHDKAYDRGIDDARAEVRRRAEVVRPDPRPAPARLPAPVPYPELAALADEPGAGRHVRTEEAAHDDVGARISLPPPSPGTHPEDTGTLLARSYESGLSMLALGAATEADERHADVAGFAEIRRQLAAVAA